MPDSIRIGRALISVSDKTGLSELARLLCSHDVEILSTGGTAAHLRDCGLPVIDVSSHTGAPEIMGGRVKSLHPRIHGGILARRGIDDEQMHEHDIAPIDLVVVNLYPFEQTIAAAGSTRSEAVEQIDIGGPAMLRAAAKNHAFVCLLTDPEDYAGFMQSFESGQGCIDEAFRRRSAAKGFALTCRYDQSIAEYLTAGSNPADSNGLPVSLNRRWHKAEELRYGENPHQRAALYLDERQDRYGLSAATQIQGKALSYNNLADADAALACVRLFTDGPSCVIVKHANPCGVARGQTLTQAYQRAFATDPTSAFGGIIAVNRPLDAQTAQCILEQQFAEIILTPEVNDDALPLLARKKNLRVLALQDFHSISEPDFQLKPIHGGLLLQDEDNLDHDPLQLESVSQIPPTPAQREDLLFAWKVAKQVKSNAIVYVRDGQTIGIGAGQMSRVDSARIATLKAQDAGLEVTGAVMASDAFFPFRDGIDTAAAAGIAAVIQPGGSIRDDEVIAAADEAGMAMLFTHIRHFRH